MSPRSRAGFSPRQSPSSSIFASMRLDGASLPSGSVVAISFSLRLSVASERLAPARDEGLEAEPLEAGPGQRVDARDPSASDLEREHRDRHPSLGGNEARRAVDGHGVRRPALREEARAGRVLPGALNELQRAATVVPAQDHAGV